uniref:Uncharacterized protein n=1 Tax=Sparus aurata TaxID=8175 RepID=A0A671TVJ9_SPAAU
MTVGAAARFAANSLPELHSKKRRTDFICCGDGGFFGRTAATCPLLEGLNLQEADSMLQLLCVPSQLRTDILAWICSRYNKMAVLWQELMLCKADDLNLITKVAKTKCGCKHLQM